MKSHRYPSKAPHRLETREAGPLSSDIPSPPPRGLAGRREASLLRLSKARPRLYLTWKPYYPLGLEASQLQEGM
jgi:hypothetical protein